MLANTQAILDAVRLLFLNYTLDAYIVPPSPYGGASEARASYLSGFTGSASNIIITKNEALIWTDGRYHLQAENQLNLTVWTLMRDGLADTPSDINWLKNFSGTKIGVDPMVYSNTAWENMERELNSVSKTLEVVSENLVDIVWGEDKPIRSKDQIYKHPVQFAGKPRKDKLFDIRKEMMENDATVLVLNDLDQIAWTFNLRGSDTPTTPIFFAYAIITMNGYELFIDPVKISPQLQATLQAESPEENIQFSEYSEILSKIEIYNNTTSGKIWLSRYCQYGLASQVSKEKQLVNRVTPVAVMKVVKNDIEVAGMIEAHKRDASALIQFFAWLEHAMANGENVTELSASEVLNNLRRAEPNNMGLSFNPIAASGPNGAIIHYRATPTTDRALNISELFLLDSGGQYKDGTTDVTRTMSFSTPSDYEKDCFTRVLKGQIALRNAIFPRKLIGGSLDVLARKALYEVGLDYLHGTSHGIGSFLALHEPPIGISYKPFVDDPGFEENMFISNEPGYYEANNFGIRLENIVRTVKASTTHNFNNVTFLTFEDVTLVPIQAKMIKMELMTDFEIEYLNNYHSKVQLIMNEYIKTTWGSKQGIDKVLEWLERETQPLSHKTIDDNDGSTKFSLNLIFLLIVIMNFFI